MPHSVLLRVFSSILAVITAQLIYTSEAFADPKHQASMRSRSSLLKSSTYKELINSGAKIALGGKRDGSSDAFKLDSANDILVTEKKESRLISFYRGLIYSKYFRENANTENFSDMQSQALAEDLFVYQTSKTLSRLLESSSLAEIYDDFVDTYRTYTTLNVARKRNGSFGVTGASENRQQEPRQKLFQFKLHLSTHNGIEPRLNIEDNLSLRYDLFRQEALIEFRADF